MHRRGNFPQLQLTAQMPSLNFSAHGLKMMGLGQALFLGTTGKSTIKGGGDLKIRKRLSIFMDRQNYIL